MTLVELITELVKSAKNCYPDTHVYVITDRGAIHDIKEIELEVINDEVTSVEIICD